MSSHVFTRMLIAHSLGINSSASNLMSWRWKPEGLRGQALSYLDAQVFHLLANTSVSTAENRLQLLAQTLEQDKDISAETQGRLQLWLSNQSWTTRLHLKRKVPKLAEMRPLDPQTTRAAVQGFLFTQQQFRNATGQEPVGLLQNLLEKLDPELHEAVFEGWLDHLKKDPKAWGLLPGEAPFPESKNAFLPQEKKLQSLNPEHRAMVLGLYLATTLKTLEDRRQHKGRMSSLSLQFTQKANEALKELRPQFNDALKQSNLKEVWPSLLQALAPYSRELGGEWEAKLRHSSIPQKENQARPERPRLG